jgi:hypothetical protein
MKKLILLVLLKFIAFFFISTILNQGIFCQDVEVEAITDSTKFLIGDQFTLTLTVKSEAVGKIIFPAIDSIPNFEIINQGKIDTVNTNGMIALSRQYLLTCFDSGSYQIPSFTFMYSKKGMSELYPAKTNPISLYFGIPVLRKDIIDIKKPLDEPVTFSEYLPYLIVLMCLIALAIVVYWYYKRRKPKPEELAPVVFEPKISAHVLALAALDKLKSENLWQKGETKEYYIKLTEILRTYIERKFRILALEMTSEEILAYFTKNLENKDILEKLIFILDNADMTKFAKKKPDENINNISLEYTYDFVNQTSKTENNQETES